MWLTGSGGGGAGAGMKSEGISCEVMCDRLAMSIPLVSFKPFRPSSNLEPFPERPKLEFGPNDVLVPIPVDDSSGFAPSLPPMATCAIEAFSVSTEDSNLTCWRRPAQKGKQYLKVESVDGKRQQQKGQLLNYTRDI